MTQFSQKHLHPQELKHSRSVLISERGIYAASPFKASRALKRAKARAPSANSDTANIHENKKAGLGFIQAPLRKLTCAQ
jgi:hypothetical protein